MTRATATRVPGAVPAVYLPDAAGARIGFHGCCVRLGARPYVHVNATHACVGVAAYEVTADGALALYTDHPPGSQVVAVVAAHDESLARFGVLAGGSGGIAATGVHFHRAADHVRVRADAASWSGQANLWFLIVTYVPRGAAAPAPG